jgi:hypothetical protein
MVLLLNAPMPVTGTSVLCFILGAISVCVASFLFAFRKEEFDRTTHWFWVIGWLCMGIVFFLMIPIAR